MQATKTFQTPQQAALRRKVNRGLNMSLRYLVAVILVLFAIAPALWVVSASFNPAKSLVGGTIFPKNPDLSNYDQLLNNEFFHYRLWMMNSFKIASITTSIIVLITCLSGYALSRFRFKGRQNLMTGILILNVFPSILAMVAIYSMVQQIGLFIPALGLDTHGGLILVYCAGSMGINVLMVKAYIDSIPLEIDESALVEGATHFQTFRHIILPMLTPMVITVAVLSFIGIYGDFLIARVLLKSMDKLTVMVGLNLFTTVRFDVDFGMVTAGAVIAAIPIILIYVPLQNYVISGLTAGSVKG